MWVARTVDFDTQTGKWHSMAVDSKGVPHLSYDAYVDGRMKYATWTEGRVERARRPGAHSRRSGIQHRHGQRSRSSTQRDTRTSATTPRTNCATRARAADRWNVQTVDQVRSQWRLAFVSQRRGAGQVGKSAHHLSGRIFGEACVLGRQGLARSTDRSFGAGWESLCVAGDRQK